MDDENTAAESDLRDITKSNNPNTAVTPGIKHWCAVIGIVCAVAGWCALFFSPTSAMVCGATGVVLSAVGIMVGKGCLRDMAITSVIASVVLLVVYAIFFWVVPYVVESL